MQKRKPKRTCVFPSVQVIEFSLHRQRYNKRPIALWPTAIAVLLSQAYFFHSHSWIHGQHNVVLPKIPLTHHHIFTQYWGLKFGNSINIQLIAQ